MQFLIKRRSVGPGKEQAEMSLLITLLSGIVGWWKPIILQTDKYTYRHWCSIGWKRRPYLCLDKDKLAPLSLWAGQKTFAFASERLSKARHQTPHTDLENRRAS